MTQSLWIPIAGTLCSGVAVFILSTYFHSRRERRKEKFDVLGRIMGNRHGLVVNGSTEANARFFEALNTVFVVFHDSKSVLAALQDFKIHKGRAPDNVTQLIRRMCENLGVDVSSLSDDFFDSPFVSGT
jgi:hypothetical protein